MERVGPQDRVVIFFAGHGEDKQVRGGLRMGYLVPVDSGKGRVKAKGELVFFALIAPDIVALGLKFKSISSGGVEHLRKFVKAALESC